MMLSSPSAENSRIKAFSTGQPSLSSGTSARTTAEGTWSSSHAARSAFDAFSHRAFRALRCQLKRCGDYEGGYGAITGPDGAIHASCSPMVPGRPDCYRRITEFGEPVGALADVDPKPAGVEDIRKPADA